MHRCRYMLLLWCIDVDMLLLWCINVDICYCYDALMYLLLLWCIDVKMLLQWISTVWYIWNDNRIILILTLQRKLSENGFIYKDFYKGWYSLSDETFIVENNVKEVQDKTGKLVQVSVFCLFSFFINLFHYIFIFNYFFKTNNCISFEHFWFCFSFFHFMLKIWRNLFLSFFFTFLWDLAKYIEV